MVYKEKEIMKGKKLLLLLFITVCALIAIYFIVKAIPDTKDPGSETTTAVTASIPLVSKAGIDVMKIRVVNQYGDETYLKDENMVWVAQRDQTAIINDTVLNRMALFGSNIYGITKVQESKDNLSIYGLDAPAQTITITYSDGSEVIFYIGMQNQVTREYYFMVENLDGVYTVETVLPGYFNFSFSDLIMYADIMIPKGTDELLEMSIAYEDNDWHLIRYEEGSPHDVSGTRAWFMLGVFENEVAVDTTYLEAIQTWFTSLELNVCEVYTATDVQLEEHGLVPGKEKGCLYYSWNDTVSAAATGKEYSEKIWLGNKTEDGLYYYVRPDDRDGIYKMLAENIDALLAYEEEMLLQKYISVINIDTVDSYSISMGDINYSASVTGVGDAGAKTYTHYHNNKALEGAASKSFYAALIGVYAEKGYIVKEQPTGKPVLTITFNRNTEELPVYEVAFYEHSVSYYKVAVNGELSYLVNARDYKTLNETITSFMANIPYAE